MVQFFHKSFRDNLRHSWVPFGPLACSQIAESATSRSHSAQRALSGSQQQRVWNIGAAPVLTSASHRDTKAVSLTSIPKSLHVVYPIGGSLATPFSSPFAAFHATSCQKNAIMYCMGVVLCALQPAGGTRPAGPPPAFPMSGKPTPPPMFASDLTYYCGVWRRTPFDVTGWPQCLNANNGTAVCLQGCVHCPPSLPISAQPTLGFGRTP